MKLVKEYLNEFEQGLDPYKAMGLGVPEPIIGEFSLQFIPNNSRDYLAKLKQLARELAPKGTSNITIKLGSLTVRFDYDKWSYIKLYKFNQYRVIGELGGISIDTGDFHPTYNTGKYTANIGARYANSMTSADLQVIYDVVKNGHHQ
jgi:hypothetical protein